MINQTIRLRKKQLNKLFPDEFTKMREEDFLTKAVENKDILNEREFEALVNVKGNIHRQREHFEFFVKRRKDKIILVPFD